MTETPNTLRENLQALRLERRDGGGTRIAAELGA